MPMTLAPARLETAQADLDGVRVVVLGHAEEEEQLGALPVGRAELPEGAAQGVDAAAAMLTEQKPPWAA
jgi:hypothetical protein